MKLRLWRSGRWPADRKVQAAVAQARLDDRQQPFEELQLHFRHAPTKTLYGLRQKRQRDPRCDADRQFPRRRAAQRFDFRLGPLQLPEHEPRMDDEGAAELGKRDTARAADYQRRL